MKKILINQPGYWGDIIYVMAIAQKYVNGGYTVYMPIFDEYLNSYDFNMYFPNINFVKISEFEKYEKYSNYKNIYEDSEFIVLPLRCSPEFGGLKHMLSKYEICGIEPNTWKNIQITRNKNKENELLKILGIKNGDKYNLINNLHSKGVISNSVPKSINNGYRDIYMKNIESFSIFDWISVIENAKTIHTVHTSIHYLIEINDNINGEVHIYPRESINEKHSKYDYLFSKNYIYH